MAASDDTYDMRVDVMHYRWIGVVLDMCFARCESQTQENIQIIFNAAFFRHCEDCHQIYIFFEMYITYM